MKHALSIRVDDKIYPYIKNLPNKSRYIEGLIREDIHQKNQQSILEQMKARILRDEEFLQALGLKLQQVGKRPIVSTRGDTQVVSNVDWGA